MNELNKENVFRQFWGCYVLVMGSQTLVKPLNNHDLTCGWLHHHR